VFVSAIGVQVWYDYRWNLFLQCPTKHFLLIAILSEEIESGKSSIIGNVYIVDVSLYTFRRRGDPPN
jgi:hypothetical protein